MHLAAKEKSLPEVTDCIDLNFWGLKNFAQRRGKEGLLIKASVNHVGNKIIFFD